MAKNKDGFELDASISADELLTYMAKERQAAKGVIAKPSANAELIHLIDRELSAQGLRLKPLGLERLADQLKAHFAPKKAQAKKD